MKKFNKKGMKKIAALTLALVFCLLNCSAAFANVQAGIYTAGGVKVTPNLATVAINNKEFVFDAYNIDGNNYFKLRDLAFILMDTNKKFDVSWDAATKTMNVVTGKEYTKIGGEMSKTEPKEASTVRSDAKIMMDGKEIQVEVYNIGGNNYFKLRDLGKEMNFNVDWNVISKTIGIDTLKVYVEK
ncbi:MAG: hypothetical protein ACTTH0_01830 [Eubacteriales bacterium]